GVIVLGTALLMLPPATNDGMGADLLTALFTATSATCVTGLVVQDTGSYFSAFGQVVILALIQIGALGIMTFSSFVALALGRRLGIRSRAALQEVMDQSDPKSLMKLVEFVVKMTFLVEASGAVLLALRWHAWCHSWSRAVYLGIFHSVSSFCNAGFSTFSDSLEGFGGDAWTVGIMGLLIILGGLGFPVVMELKERTGPGGKGPLSVHTKLVLIVTGVLLASGMGWFLLLEWGNSLKDIPFGRKILSAWFQSVTARTAGFNTVDIGSLRNVTLFLFMAWMFVGASPGGTGGGIKTTTLGILVLSVRAALRGRGEVEAFGRAIPPRLVYRAVAIAVVGLGLLGTFAALLLATQEGRQVGVMFEAVSAFGTVGLSTGVTPNLTPLGRVLVVVLMFAGRLGPLTITLAIRERPYEGVRRLPSARVMTG
ncbi:MAG TPA: Trk family potassium uptake protein, partial [Candidatus Latescibacteria bacterium]|nr:Trk family potassium uptake protein [Candidatus Latescibacterota bacterium]